MSLNETSPLLMSDYNKSCNSDDKLVKKHHKKKHNKKHHHKHHKKHHHIQTERSNSSDNLITLSSNSSSNSSSDESCNCYICYEPIKEDIIFYPCKCRFGYVHIGCIENWIKRGNHTCNICKTKYIYKGSKKIFWMKYLRIVGFVFVGIIIVPIFVIIVGIPLFLGVTFFS